MKRRMLTTATIFILSLLLSQPSISQEIVEYTCPMHTHYISTDADGICPVCGMGLVAARLSQATLSAPEDIQVSEGMLQTMGVRVAEVKKNRSEPQDPSLWQCAGQHTKGSCFGIPSRRLD